MGGSAMGIRSAGLKARRDLPASYSISWELDLTRNQKAAIALNLAGLPLFALFGWVFLKAAALLHPAIGTRLFVGQITPYPFVFFLIVFAVVVGTMIIHEAIHGAFFWLFTRSRPAFGMKLLFAYAGAPEWYLPRNQYALTGIAPFVFITLFGFVVIAVAPLAAGQLALFGITMNAAGAVGDFYVSAKVMLHSRDVLIRDTGVGFTLFSPGNTWNQSNESQNQGRDLQ